MKIISFLGFSHYTETIYLHPTTAEAVKTPFFQEALVQFYQPDTLYVLLTKTVATKIPHKATASNWQTLQDRLGNRVKLEPIYDIPESNSPEDGWVIFDKITECLNPGDRVIFDLTHSFRSIPVVALLAISYLRAVRQVTVAGLVYGAFDPNAKDRPTPTYDLLPMLSLLDWIAAADRFVKVGDGAPLAELLKNAIPGSERKNNPAVRPLGAQLDQASKIIGSISQAIALARPLETLELTARLEETLGKADASFDQRAKPFNLIKDQLLAEYGQFALPDPWDSDNLPRNLWLQFQLIQWYETRGQIMPAMTLASEWLISLTAYRLGAGHILEHRRQIDYALNNGAARLQKKEPAGASEFDEAFQSLADYETLSQLWNELTQIRNDIAHGGMNRDPKPAKTLQNRADSLLPRLREMAEVSLFGKGAG
ncbi:MAG: TIGR02221 family CRISPR-associated protein [Cyanobacteriota bacterium]|jgi:CRISPR-associated Csx2 family protein